MLSADLLPGGRADRMTPEMFDPLQLARGTSVEFEHTRDMALAREIAMDHLAEDPDYYRKLATIHLDGDSAGGGGLAVVGVVLAFAAGWLGFLYLMSRGTDLAPPPRPRRTRRQPFTG